VSDGPATPTAAEREALEHFGYASFSSMPFDPVALARRWRTRYQDPFAQIAQGVIHERASSSIPSGPEYRGPRYWPCTFCSVRSKEATKSI